MKKSSRRALSRVLATVMLVSTMLTNVAYADTTNGGGVIGADAATSTSAVEVVTAFEAVAQAGQTYTVDFKTAAASLEAAEGAQVASEDGVIVYTNVSGQGFYHGSSYGIAVKPNDTVDVAVAGNAKISFTLSKYAPTDSVFTVTNTEGTALGEISAYVENDKTDNTFEYEGDATTLTFTYSGSGQGYLAQVTAVNEAEASETTNAAEAGKTYTADFVALDDGAKSSVDGMTFDSTITMAAPGAYYHGSGHGLALKDGDQIEIAVAGGAEITFKVCQFGHGTTYTVTDADGNELGSIAAVGNSDGETQTFKYSGEATTLTFTLAAAAGEAYLHAISVANDAVPVGEAENFEFWLDDVAADVDGVLTIEQQEFKFADSSLILVGNKSGDELTPFTPSWASGVGVTRAGKVVNGYKAGNRNATPNDITTIPVYGDGTAIVFTPAATGTFNTYFASGSFLRVWDFNTATGERVLNADGTYYVDSETAAESFAFKAVAGHTYVLSTTGKTNNMVFCGFEYIIDEPVDTAFAVENINAHEDSLSTLEIYLTDVALGTVDGTVTAAGGIINLAKGHTYKLSTNDGGVQASASADEVVETIKITGDDVTIYLTDIPDQTLTGTITGTEVGTVTALTFTNQINGVVYEAVIDGDQYTCIMKPGEYNTAVETTNGGVTYDHVSVALNDDNVNAPNEVYVELPDPGYYELPQEIQDAESELTFVNNAGLKYNNDTSIAMYEGDQIIVPVSGVQKITVAGWYAGAWNINGENQVEILAGTHGGASDPLTNSYTTDGTETSVTINATAGPTYLYWIQVEDVYEFTSVVNVPEDYATLNEADDVINAMVNRPEGEKGRVTINLNTDVQEQVKFDADYVTLNGNGHEINWYYGVGTFYYSIDSNGLYSETLFRDKYASREGDGNLWGGVALIYGDHFIAENTVFKNTYNYYVTEKELEDYAGHTSGMADRVSLDTDVTAYSAKERSNAFYIAADDIEIYNCQILSSQDTFGRNGSTNYNYHVYVKDSVIGGNVDYICGEFTAVFDNCELQWKTYTNDTSGNNAKIGYITAAKTSPYIFRNCTVTTDTDENGTVLGYYGRTWGANSLVYFTNCETNGYINTVGWGEMSSGDIATANFNEYNNTSNGEAIVTTGGEVGTTTFYAGNQVTDEALIADLTTNNLISAYLAGWTPRHYTKLVTLLGDVDEDTYITANDAAAAMQYVLNPVFNGYERYNFSNADVDGIAGIEASDAAFILQKALRSTTKFPAASDENTDVDLDPVTVYVVGDSTACDYAANADTTYYYKRVGFGTRLGDYLADEATVVNYALSGRSSKSFTTEANYTALMNNMSEGDYLIIAFGHNDEKAEDAARYTEPLGDKDTEGSFKNSLYVNYIQPALAKGVTPILATPIVRRTDSGSWSNNQLHVANGKSYGDCVIELGEELGLTVIDNLAMTKALYDELTPAETVYLHAWLSSKSTSVDSTHLNNYGAAYVSYLMASAIKASDNTLSAYVGDITAPDKSELIVNPDYVEPSSDDVTGEDLISKYWTTTSPWYATAFGNIGGQSKLNTVTYAEDGETVISDVLTINDTTGTTNFAINEIDATTVQIRTGDVATSQAYGKIDSTTDSFTLYYIPVDAGSNFEISATATVNSVLGHTQASFGAICLDRILVDTNAKEAYNYVSAGSVKYTTGSVYQTFARDAATSALTTNAATVANDPAAGDVVNVKLTKVGNTFTATYGDTTATYEKEMEGTVYFGFYTTRCADVTFSNISYNNEVTE